MAGIQFRKGMELSKFRTTLLNRFFFEVTHQKTGYKFFHKLCCLPVFIYRCGAGKSVGSFEDVLEWEEHACGKKIPLNPMNFLVAFSN